MLPAGKRDKLITIERKAVTQEHGYGTKVITWVPVVAKIHAEIQDVLPSKSVGVQQGIKIDASPVRVRFQFIRNLTSDMRVVEHRLVGNRILQIVGGPAILGRRDGIELLCSEYSTPGNP